MILSQMNSCCSFFGRFLDVLVHDHELGHRGHVETAADVEERLHDLGIGVGLDGKIDLHVRHVPVEFPVILPELLVIDHENRGPVLCSKVQQQFLPGVPDVRNGEGLVRPVCFFRFFLVSTAALVII